MTYTKIIGLIFVFTCPFIFGIAQSSKIKKQLAFSKGVLELIRYIKTQIELFKSPLGSIYSSFSNGSLQNNGFLEILRSGGWDESLIHLRKKDLCSKNIFPLLTSFGSGLGKSDVFHQSENCTLHIALLEKEIEQQSIAAVKDSKLAVLLGIVIGLLAVIFLI